MAEIKDLRILLNDYYSSRRDECLIIDNILCQGVVLKIDEVEIEPNLYGSIEGKISNFRPNRNGSPNKDYGFLDFFLRQDSSFDLVWYNEKFIIERAETLPSRHFILKNFHEYMKSRSQQYTYLGITKNKASNYELTTQEIQNTKNSIKDNLRWVHSSMFDIMNCETLRKFLNELNYPYEKYSSREVKRICLEKVDVLPSERDHQRLLIIENLLRTDKFYSLMLIKEDTAVFWNYVEKRMKVSLHRYKDIYRKLSKYKIKEYCEP